MVFDTLSSLFGSVPSDVVVDSISSGIPSKLLGTSLAYSRRVPLLARASCHSRALFPMRLHFFQPITKLLADDSDYPDVTTADAGVFATANGFAAMALNRGKVKNFVLGTRKMYKGWAHGYLGAVRAVRREMVRTVAAGVKSTLGPSAVYACSMQVATSAMGLPSLVSVGAANVATPVIVSKLGGRLRNSPRIRSRLEPCRSLRTTSSSGTCTIRSRDGWTEASTLSFIRRCARGSPPLIIG